MIDFSVHWIISISLCHDGRQLHFYDYTSYMLAAVHYCFRMFYWLFLSILFRSIMFLLLKLLSEENLNYKQFAFKVSLTFFQVITNLLRTFYYSLNTLLKHCVFCMFIYWSYYFVYVLKSNTLLNCRNCGNKT